MSEEETYKGIPREKILWDPIINYKKCVSCGKCAEFCHMGAFKFEEKDDKKQTTVVPNRCVVFCHGCEDVCPEGAITHPSDEETQKLIEKLQNAALS